MLGIRTIKTSVHRFKRSANSAYRWLSSRSYNKRRIWGLGLLCGGSLISVGLLYIENIRLRHRLRLVSDITSTEKASPSYIYVDQESNIYRDRKQTSRKVLFPYLQSRSHDPSTLLRLALSDEHAVRLLGVKALSQPHNWTDAEYRMLAQALDYRALIGLARMPNSDQRFFLPQPKLRQTEELMEDQLRHLLSSLPLDNLDLCTKYFTSSALQEGNESKKNERGGMWCFGGNGLAFTQSLSAVPEEIVETFCLQALEKHSFRSVWTFEGGLMFSDDTLSPSVWVENLCLHALLGASILPSHCPKIVQLGGLSVLQRIYEVRQNSVKITRSIARILANLAVHPSLHKDITDTGWVGILHKWLNSKDLALSLHAARALANLDLDFAGHKKYVDGVYLYYPQKRYSEPVYADIVFVHGLMGGPFRTWRQKDTVLKQLREEKQRKEKQLQASSGDKNTGSKQNENVNKTIDKLQTDEQTKNTINVINTNKAVSDSGKCDKNSGNKNLICEKENRINNKTGTERVNLQKTESVPNNSLETKAHVEKVEDSQKVKQLINFNKFNPSKWDVKELFGGKREQSQAVKKKRSLYTFCWPKDWLAQDIPNIRILTVEYDTHLSEWAPKCPYEGEKRAIATRSKELLDKLRTAGIGDRPVIWVGHSMGGLLIKEMLVSASSDVRYKNMVEKTRGIVFYSVPHKGSPLAAYGNHAKYLFNPSVEVKELKMDSPNLLELHHKFKEMMFELGIPLLSFAEGEKTDLPLNLKVLIVPPESSDPEFGEFHLMPDLNHLNICKPDSDRAQVYRLTLTFLQDCLPLHRVPNILKATVNDEFVLSEEEVS